MSQIALSPDGAPLIALYATEKEAEAAQQRVFDNGKQNRADRNPEIRRELIDGKTSLADVKRSDSGKTLRWDIPRQIPLGPHIGEWCIHVPADIARTYQRDPKTGDIAERPAPEFAGVKTVENDPAWWPKEDEV